MSSIPYSTGFEGFGTSTVSGSGRSASRREGTTLPRATLPASSGTGESIRVWQECTTLAVGGVGDPLPERLATREPVQEPESPRPLCPLTHRQRRRRRCSHRRPRSNTAYPSSTSLFKHYYL